MYCSSVGCPGSVGCPSGEGDERVLLDFTHRSDIKRVTPTNQPTGPRDAEEGGEGDGTTIRFVDGATVGRSDGRGRRKKERKKEWDKERKGEGGNDQKWEERKRENWKGGGEGGTVVVVVVKDEWEREGRPNVAPPPTMVCGVPL